MKRWYVNHSVVKDRRMWFGDLCTSESRVAQGLRLVAALGSVDHWTAITCAEHVGRPPSVGGSTNFKAHLRTEQHFDQIGWEAAAGLARMRRWSPERIQGMRHTWVVVDAAPCFELFHHYEVISCHVAVRRMLGALSDDELARCLGVNERWVDSVDAVRRMRYRREHRDCTPQLHQRRVDLLVSASDAWMQWIGEELRIRRSWSRRPAAGSP